MNTTLLHRLWHWLTALTVLGLVGTFFLRKTFLSWRTNSRVIEEGLTAEGVEITAGLAKTLAKTIRAPMWEWHYYLGFALVVLLAFRLLLFLFFDDRQVVRSSLFGSQFRTLRSNATKHSAELAAGIHRARVYTLYLVVFGVLFFMSASGVLLCFDDSLGLSRELVESTKEAHEWVAWLASLFIPLHIVGVVFAELRVEPGIVSKMIGGSKE
ncbi:MAG: cytochrome b/b6 domain-containing protein [Proteobacteria bacterium]|jgi:Ni/Fe-hydrogenase 1 B-type cytochrome subunit|nr:cytochrome b/b6 domain-containing protein [Pseudomonadota bacterium]